MTGNVFLIYCELAADSLPLQREGYAGGFVVCFVYATEICQAIDCGKKALESDGYTISDIEKAVRFDAMEWQHEHNYLALAAECLNDRTVVYSNFDVWGH